MEDTLFLTDLIDPEILQEMQDSFSKMTGIASYITDTDGNYVTEGSNLSDFCSKYTNAAKDGLERCRTCDANSIKFAYNQRKPITYHCHAGLRNYAAPIILDDKLVGCIFGGQFLDAPHKCVIQHCLPQPYYFIGKCQNKTRHQLKIRLFSKHEPRDPYAYERDYRHG